MINSGGYEVVAGSVDGRVRYYDIRMGKMDTDVLGAPVTSLASMKDGEAVLVSTLDGRVRLVDRKNGSCLMTYKGHENAEFRIRSCFGGRERWVLCGSEGIGSVLDTKGRGGEVVVWDTVSGEVLKREIVEEPGKQEGSMKKRAIGRDGTDKQRRNVISCVAWKNGGTGNQWCCAGTDGVVTVFGE
jgi:mitogen-activated protein kinase organizer 1